jgi:hypothetical protein
MTFDKAKVVNMELKTGFGAIAPKANTDDAKYPAVFAP